MDVCNQDLRKKARLELTVISFACKLIFRITLDQCPFFWNPHLAILFDLSEGIYFLFRLFVCLFILLLLLFFFVALYKFLSFLLQVNLSWLMEIYCDFSSFPMLYDTILLQSIFVRVTGNCLRNALNVVSDMVW